MIYSVEICVDDFNEPIKFNLRGISSNDMSQTNDAFNSFSMHTIHKHVLRRT